MLSSDVLDIQPVRRVKRMIRTLVSRKPKQDLTERKTKSLEARRTSAQQEMNESLATLITRSQKPGGAFAPKPKDRFHCSLTPDQPTGIKFSQLHLMMNETPIVHGFLKIPAEIRNEIYKHLMPDATDLSDIIGLICACKQVHQELSSMVVAETNRIIEQVKQHSVALRDPRHTKKNTNGYVGSSTIETHSQLRNVTLSIPISAGYRRSLPELNYYPITLSDVLSGLNEALGLHIPYLTIDIPCRYAGDTDLSDPIPRYTCLNTCYRMFRDMRKEGCVVNAQHVIFKLRCETWNSEGVKHLPIIAFVRQLCRNGKVGYEFLGHDPRWELPNARTIQGIELPEWKRQTATLSEEEEKEQWTSDIPVGKKARADGMQRLNAIVAKSCDS